MGQHLTPRFAHFILKNTCQWIPCFGYHDRMCSMRLQAPTPARKCDSISVSLRCRRRSRGYHFSPIDRSARGSSTIKTTIFVDLTKCRTSIKTSLSSHFSFRRLAPRFQHHDGKLNSSLSAANQDFIPWNNQ